MALRAEFTNSIPVGSIEYTRCPPVLTLAGHRVFPYRRLRASASGADLYAVANRVLWSHPLARLLPLLDMLRSDGGPPERR